MYFHRSQDGDSSGYSLQASRLCWKDVRVYAVVPRVDRCSGLPAHACEREESMSTSGRVFVVERLDLLDLMRGAEPSKKCGQCGSGWRTGVAQPRGSMTSADLLDACRNRSGGRPYVRWSPNGQRVGGKVRARGNVKSRQRHLACDLVHVRDHQRQALRCGVGEVVCARPTGANRAVPRPRRLRAPSQRPGWPNRFSLAFAAVVYVLCHRRGRRDQEDPPPPL